MCVTSVYTELLCLLIVLNGIEIFHNVQCLTLRHLLIVLNGIEIRKERHDNEVGVILLIVLNGIEI